MKLNKALTLYAITDRTWLRENERLAGVVEEVIQGGATMIQIREKKLSDPDFLTLAKEVQTVCKKYNVPFIINDNASLAVKLAADGLHVGQSDLIAAKAREAIGSGKILGVSAATVAEALLAEKMGADYLGVGAIFSTDTKKDAENVSLATLREITKAVKIPVVAIGGISKDNISQLKGTEVAGICVISDLFSQKNKIKRAQELKAEIEKIL